MSREDFSLIDHFEDETYILTLDKQEVIVSCIDKVQEKLDEILKNKKTEFLKDYGVFTKIVGNELIIYGKSKKGDFVKTLSVISITNFF